MSSKSNVRSDQIEPVNGFFAGGKTRSAAELARSVSAVRAPKQATARARIATPPKSTKRQRVKPLGPTPERMAKGDVDLRVGTHRAIPPIERLRDQGKLAPKQLDNGRMTYDPRENQGLYEAALKLRRHFDGCLIGVKAQDLNKVMGGSASDDLAQEEGWVHHFDMFREACRVMGWPADNPHRGAGRIVVDVVCYEIAVYDSSIERIPGGRKEALLAAGMDRLREGLWALAGHWRMV